MPHFDVRLVSDSNPVTPNSSPQGDARDDDAAMDAFSRVVIQVADKLRPAVVNLRSGAGRRGGTGSGVLFTPDGFLLTNHHVVKHQERVEIRLHDGTEFSGRVVGADP